MLHDSGSIMETNVPVAGKGKTPDLDRNERTRQFQILAAFKQRENSEDEDFDIGILWGLRLDESVRTSPDLVSVYANDDQPRHDEAVA